MRAARREGGGASVEFVGTLPVVLVVALVSVQVIMTGASLWSAAIAARAGARAAHVGDPVERAVRDALPAPLRDGAGVTGGDGSVGAEVTVPRVLPVLPRYVVEATSSLE